MAHGVELVTCDTAVTSRISWLRISSLTVDAAMWEHIKRDAANAAETDNGDVVQKTVEDIKNVRITRDSIYLNASILCPPHYHLRSPPLANWNGTELYIHFHSPQTVAQQEKE